jgi:hypothetical protein
METDWVKRKAIGEQFIEGERDHIWEDLCRSLQSAVNSYTVHYGGVATGHYENDHQFRIAVTSKPPYQGTVVDVTFMPPEIRVTCTKGICKTLTFLLNPNKDKPFRNVDKQPLSNDQVSEAILRSVFFPAECRGVQTPIVSPCSS